LATKELIGFTIKRFHLIFVHSLDWVICNWNDLDSSLNDKELLFLFPMIPYWMRNMTRETIETNNKNLQVLFTIKKHGNDYILMVIIRLANVQKVSLTLWTIHCSKWLESPEQASDLWHKNHNILLSLRYYNDLYVSNKVKNNRESMNILRFREK
jgi:hypothetical protein